MKKIITITCAVVVAALSYTFINADTGREGATRIERGSYVASRSVAIVDSAATEIIPPSANRPDAICKNYSSFTIFLGSAAAGTTLRDIGLPIGASEYFKLDGSMTGSISAIAESGATNVAVKCLDGLVP